MDALLTWTEITGDTPLCKASELPQRMSRNLKLAQTFCSDCFTLAWGRVRLSLGNLTAAEVYAATVLIWLPPPLCIIYSLWKLTLQQISQKGTHLGTSASAAPVSVSCAPAGSWTHWHKHLHGSSLAPNTYFPLQFLLLGLWLWEEHTSTESKVLSCYRQTN